MATSTYSNKSYRDLSADASKKAKEYQQQRDSKEPKTGKYQKLYSLLTDNEADFKSSFKDEEFNQTKALLSTLSGIEKYGIDDTKLSDNFKTFADMMFNANQYKSELGKKYDQVKDAFYDASKVDRDYVANEYKFFESNPKVEVPNLDKYYKYDDNNPDDAKRKQYGLAPGAFYSSYNKDDMQDIENLKSGKLSKAAESKIKRTDAILSLLDRDIEAVYSQETPQYSKIYNFISQKEAEQKDKAEDWSSITQNKDDKIDLGNVDFAAIKDKWEELKAAEAEVEAQKANGNFQPRQPATPTRPSTTEREIDAENAATYQDQFTTSARKAYSDKVRAEQSKDTDRAKQDFLKLNAATVSKSLIEKQMVKLEQSYQGIMSNPKTADAFNTTLQQLGYTPDAKGYQNMLVDAAYTDKLPELQNHPTVQEMKQLPVYATSFSYDEAISQAEKQLEERNLDIIRAQGAAPYNHANVRKAQEAYTAAKQTITDLKNEKYYTEKETAKNLLITDAKNQPDFKSAVNTASASDLVPFDKMLDKRAAVIAKINEDETKKIVDLKLMSTFTTSALERDSKKLVFASPEETDALRYYYQIGDMDKFDQLYNVLSRQLDERYTAWTQKNDKTVLDKMGSFGKFVSGLTSIAMTPLQAGAYFDTIRQSWQNTLTGEYEPVNLNSPVQRIPAVKGEMREYALEGAEGFGRTLLGWGYGLGDFAMNTLTTGGVGTGTASLVTMGASAAGQVTNEALQKGASPDEAVAMGTLAGATEILTEKIPIDNLFKLIGKGLPKKTFGVAVVQTLKQGGIEGAEEVVSEYANILYDIQIMKDKSEFMQRKAALIEEGMSEQDAQSKAEFEFFVQNPAIAFGGGAFMGLMLGGFASFTDIEKRYINRKNSTDGSAATQTETMPVQPTETQEGINTLPETETNTAANTASNDVQPLVESAPKQNVSLKQEGFTGTAKANDGKAISYKYAIIDTQNVIASHDVDMNVNGKYPQELQPRDRTRTASASQIDNIVKNLQPEFLGANPKVSDGAPIIGEDGIVESGNGRVIALQKAFQSNPVSAKKYTDYLKEHAAEFGIDANNISKNSILVRVRTSDVDRVNFVYAANESNVAQMSTSEVAKSDSYRVKDILSLFTPSDSGEINTSNNFKFIKAFVNTMPANEQSLFMDADGNLSKTGLQRIQNAIFYLAYENSNAMERMSESLDDNVKGVTRALTNIAPRIVEMKRKMEKGELYDMNFSQDISSAAEKFSDLKDSKMSVGVYLNQLQMFDDGMSIESKNMLAVFENNGRSIKKMTDFFNTIFDIIEERGNPNQVTMFTEDAAPTKQSVLEHALRRYNLEYSGLQQATLTVWENEPQTNKKMDEGRYTERESENPENKETASETVTPNKTFAEKQYPEMQEPQQQTNNEQQQLQNISREQQVLQPPNEYVNEKGIDRGVYNVGGEVEQYQPLVEARDKLSATEAVQQMIDDNPSMKQVNHVDAEKGRAAAYLEQAKDADGNFDYEQAKANWIADNKAKVERGDIVDVYKLMAGHTLVDVARRNGDTAGERILTGLVALGMSEHGSQLAIWGHLVKTTVTGMQSFMAAKFSKLKTFIQNKYGDKKGFGYEPKKGGAMASRTGTGVWGKIQEIQAAADERIAQLWENGTPSDEDISALQRQVAAEIAEALPFTWRDKFMAWRFMAMLGNPRSASRNFVSNTIKYGAEWLDRQWAAIMERMSKLDKNDYQYALGFRTYERGSDTAQAINKSVETIGKDHYDGTDKYEISNPNMHGKTVFKNKVLKAGERATKIIMSDWLFWKAQYKSALGQMMKARGSATITPQMEQLALERADYATFRQKTKFSQWAARVKAKKGVGGVLLMSVAPFTRTPANIAVEAVDRSIIGTGKAIYNALVTNKTEVTRIENEISILKKQATEAQTNQEKTALVKKLKFNVEALAEARKQAVEKNIKNFSRNITGTILSGLGVALSSLGLIVLRKAKDPEERKFGEQQGVQEYALAIPNADGSVTYISLDWAMPIAFPLLIGAEMYQGFAKSADEEDNPDILMAAVDSVLNAAQGSFETFSDLSMLSGSKYVISELGKTINGDEDANILGVVSDNLFNYYVGQNVPAVLRNAGSTIDPRIVSTKGSTWLESKLFQLQKALPVKPDNMPTVIDIWGNKKYAGAFGENIPPEEQTAADFGWRLAQNFGIPATITYGKADPVNSEIERLIATGEIDANNVLPTLFSNKVINTQKAIKAFGKPGLKLTAKDIEELQIRIGKETYKKMTQLINKSGYAGASTLNKSKSIKALYTDIASQEKEKFLNEKIKAKK